MTIFYLFIIAAIVNNDIANHFCRDRVLQEKRPDQTFRQNEYCYDK